VIILMAPASTPCRHHRLALPVVRFRRIPPVRPSLLVTDRRRDRRGGRCAGRCRRRGGARPTSSRALAEKPGAHPALGGLACADDAEVLRFARSSAGQGAAGRRQGGSGRGSAVAGRLPRQGFDEGARRASEARTDGQGARGHQRSPQRCRELAERLPCGVPRRGRFGGQHRRRRIRREIGRTITPAGAARALEAANVARRRISYNVSPQLAIEAMLFDIREVLRCPR
jgi:hypothetical protein